MTQARRRRLQKQERKTELLDHAIAEAKAVGFSKISREGIARRADCSPGLIAYHLGNGIALRKAVMRAAVQRRELLLVAQGLAIADPIARRAPLEVRNKAVELIAGC